MGNSILRRAALLLSLALMGTAARSAGQEERTYQLNIPAGKGSTTLSELGRVTGVTMKWLPDFDDVATQQIAGTYTASSAIAQMLGDIDFSIEIVNARTLTIRHREKAPPRPSIDATEPKPVPAIQPSEPDLLRQLFNPPEVVVRAVNLRGSTPIGTSLLELRLGDPASMFRMSLTDALRTFPQNFGGGPSEDTREIGREADTNSARGYSFNLRALDASATAVLLNGHPLPFGGSEGIFVDVSNLPSAGIDRIEAVADGASALHAVSAPGGVVNIRTLAGFDGAETILRYETATAGSQTGRLFSQILGVQRDSAGAMLVIESYERDSLAASERWQASSDQRRAGGSDQSPVFSNPGTVQIGNEVYAVPRGQDGRSLVAGDFVPGTANRQDKYAGADILPQQRRRTVLGTFRYSPHESWHSSGHALCSKRNAKSSSGGYALTLSIDSSNPFYVNPLGGSEPMRMAYNFLRDLGPLTLEADVRTCAFAIDVGVDLEGEWKVGASVSRGAEKQRQIGTGFVNNAALAIALADPNPATAFNPFGDGSVSNADTLRAIRDETFFESKSGLGIATLTIGGPVFPVPGGQARLTMGFDRQRQSFSTILRAQHETLQSANSSQRDIHSAYAELRVPIAEQGQARRGMHKLAFSAAARVDRYSDFGETFMPRFGAEWEPLRGVALRGTFGRSYRAPSLADLFGVSNSSITRLADSQASFGARETLLWMGKNAGLHAETGRSLTFGVVLGKEQGGSALALTYFNTRIHDRIAALPPTAGLLLEPAYADYVIRDPSLAQREQVCEGSVFQGPVEACLGTPVEAIVDLRQHNTGIGATSGIDMAAQHFISTRFGKFSARLLGTYVLSFSEARSRSAPRVERVNTQNNPIDLRMQGTLQWEHRRYSAAAVLSYADSYRDTTRQPNRRVDWWGTVDLVATIDFGVDARGSPGRNHLSIAVQNVADQDPPFLNNAVGLGYDAENADLFGRVFRVEFRRQW